MLPLFLKISDDLLVQAVGGETSLLDPAGEQYFGMNQVGTCFFDAAPEGRSVGAAVACIPDSFDVEPPAVETGFEALIGQFRDRGLVRVARY